jgi:hypothetical protein
MYLTPQLIAIAYKSGRSHENQLCPSLMTSEGVVLEET